ncbi:MAG: FGGY family carbohydrate kinase [Gammaproteobacteria bacterium]
MGSEDTPLFLCLDQGGHASRAVVINSTGDIKNIVFREISTQRDGVRVEHDPDELLLTLREAAEEVAGQYSLSAAGLATQRSSIVCWDRKTGEALSPVLSWQDRRAADWLESFKGYERRIHELTGLMLSPHYGVSKLIWCLENIPAVMEAHQTGRLMFGPLAAWLAGRLCNGVPNSADPANGSRTLLWDRQKNSWSTELLELFGVPEDCLPQAVNSAHDWGNIAVANQELPLSIVTGDQSAALFAFGQPDKQNVYANLGTGAFLQRIGSGIGAGSGRLLNSVVYAEADNVVTVLEGTINGAGAAISKFADEHSADMEKIKQESSGWLGSFDQDLLYLNAVSGLGSPWWLSDVESRFTAEASIADQVSAILESIAFMAAVNVQAGNHLAGANCSQIIVTGGLGSVDPLLQRIADLTGATVDRTRITEATVRGLAYLLAGQPHGWPGPSVQKQFQPEENSALVERYKRWIGLMPAIPDSNKWHLVVQGG